MSKCTTIEYRTSFTDWEKIGRPNATLPGGQSMHVPAVLIHSTRWETDCAPMVAASLDLPDGSTVWFYFDETQVAAMVECMADAKKEAAERTAA